MGALVSTFCGENLYVLSTVIFFLGILCHSLRLDQSGYLFSCITFAIIVIVPHASPGWMLAIPRFIELSVGIVVGLVISAFWRLP